MKTELVEVSPIVKQINLEIESTEIKPFYDKVVQKYARLASVPGFRKGYAPVGIVKTRFREDINNDVLRDLLPERVTQAIQEHALNPLSEPRLSLENAENVNLTGNDPLKVEILVEVMPQLETPNYKGLEAVRRVRPVDEEAVEKMIQERRQEHASFAPVEDRPAAVGDTITVDINGQFVDEPEAEPISVNDLEIELGSENVQEEFTRNLGGVQPDETKTFTIEYPADFTSPGLAGKKVEYTATVKSVGRVELPELNDEWVKSLNEGEDNFQTVDELRNKLRQDLETMTKLESDNRLRDELMNKLIDANPIEVPPTITSYQAQGLTRQFAANMERQGIDMRNADEKLWQMLFQRMLPQAEREVRGALLLDKIATTENVEVAADEINEEIENIAKFSNRTPEDVRQALASEQNGENEIRERLRNRKAIEVLVDNAVITDGEWQEATEEASAQTAATPEGENQTSSADNAEPTEPEKKDEAVQSDEAAPAVAEQKAESAAAAPPKKSSKKSKAANSNEGEAATAASEN